ncbi:MAG: TraB/GumN family protein [Asticcacaulis sp.]
MKTTAIWGALVLMMATPVVAQAQEVADADWSTTEVSVVKRIPGPALWRVVKDDKVVWIITSTQIETSASWDSRRIENILTGAETLYTPPVATGGITLIWRLMKDKDLPGKTTLKDVLPPDEYSRFQETARRHGVKTGDIEKDKPLWAGMRLSTKVNEARGYSTDGVVGRLSKAAKKKKVKIRAVADYEAKPLLARINAIDETEGRRCLTLSLDGIDYAVKTTHTATQAWAEGDVARLKSVLRAKPKADCLEALGADLTTRSTHDAISVVEKAMKGARRSVLILPAGMLLLDDRLVSELRARGYQVREP